jgi:hypothetical protein
LLRRSFEEVLSAAHSTLAGDVTRLLLDVAVWNYRQYASERTEQSHAAPLLSQVEPRLSRLLEHVLSQHGNNAHGAHSMLGPFVPDLYVLAPAWTVASEERLFGDGVEDPILHPIWGAYILRSRFSDNTFRQLRPWYARAAVAHSNATEEGSKAVNSEVSLARGLASHVLIAVTQGLACITDEDMLVKTTFSSVSAKDRSRSYWTIFRQWKDSPIPVSAELTRRLVVFWDWRLSELEQVGDTPDRSVEAEGLLWFLATPHIPPSDVIRLGRRTLILTPGRPYSRWIGWERISELALADPVGTFELLTLIVEQEFTADYGVLPYDGLAQPLRAALTCGDAEIRGRARRLINRMGERGHVELGKLLSSEAG